MDQSRKRRLNNRKPGLSQCKVARAEEPEDVSASRDVTDATGSHRHFNTIRASSPQSDSSCQEQHAACIQKPEDDAEKTLIITCDKEQGGTRTPGRRKGLRRKRDTVSEVEAQQKEAEDEIEIDRELDRELENKSRQHNLTSANVRSIIHEVITNEHVVAMMKAAISETEPIPVFEPKMTRSKLKEVVEKGVVIPAWNISPIKKPTEVKKGPQFVDIPLEEEDSSDEEYRPDEEEEDETAEESLLESDFENSSSSPRGSRVNLHRSHSEHEEDGASSSRLNLRRSRHLTVAVTPVGPPPPPPAPSRAPPECSFLEKLHAVDEDLAIGPECMESCQSVSSANGEESLISFRTRSKRPLRDVPLRRLEAELRAPDITPDMYEFGSAPEDREWTQWLQGLMSSDTENEEEGDDEDDPEYNFLADIDEPDVYDFRNDKAVRITKKEVNDLMEELFDTFQDELRGQEEDGHEEKEEEDSPLQEQSGILENIQYQDPLADVLKQQYRTVREQLVVVRKRKALLESKGVSVPPPCPQRPSSPITSLTLSTAQKLQLQQQIQQHVQLLTQMNMLCSSVKGLETEASTSRQFLLELQMFAQREEQPCDPEEHGFTSIFKACNLQGAISLLEELDQSPKGDPAVSSPRFPGCQFPAPLAWLMATRPVFLYPELLPTTQLRSSRFKGPFTSAEDCLVVLGHKHLRSTLHPLLMTCRYLLAARSFISLKSHIRDACHKPFPSVIKTYFVTGKCPTMPLACKRVGLFEQRPPVEREKSLIPDWLSKNLKRIYELVIMFNQRSGNSQTTSSAEEAAESPGSGAHCSFSPGMRYPPSLPEDLAQTLESSPLGSCKKKKDKPAKSTKPLKPPPSAEELEVVLNQLPTLLPKTITVPSLSLSEPFHLAPVLRPEPISCLSGNGATNGPSERAIIVSNVSNVPPMGRNPGGDVATLPPAPVAPNLSSSRTIPVKNAVETPMGVSGSPQRAQVGATQGDVIITLPAALAPELNPCPSGHITVNQTAQIVTSNALITLQPPTVPNTVICPTTIIKTSTANVPSAKDCQHCGTLLKVIPRDSGGLAQIPLNWFLLVPPGYVIASSSLGHQIAEQDQTLKGSSALNSTELKLRKQQRTPDIFHSIDGPHGGPPQMTSVHDAPFECLQETAAAEEELNNDDGGLIENEVEECGEKDPRELFLTLSESSGSPTPNIDGEDADMEMVLSRREKLEEQKSNKRQGSNRMAGVEKDGGASDVMFVPELQKTIEKFSHLATKTRCEKEGSTDDGKSNHQPAGAHRTCTVESPLVLYDDAPDGDPCRDAKDVVFAQAYLEKVCEVLQMVPGKVNEFLSVLSEFEKDPESRTSLELLKRLKPVLSDWPELLRDFAAFLHPDQARECGLLAEQQAFERSRRFLRQLECTFGEQSDLYRKVVHILQGGLSQDLADFREMKAQITWLFRDHADLLEAFWEFFKQLCPQVQDEDRADNVETSQGLEGNHACQPIRTVLPDKKVEPVKTADKHRRKRDKHVLMAETKMNNAKKHSVAAESKIETAESSSVDSQQSLFNATGSSVCAKNISRTPNGKKVVLWTREADRVILTTCQQRGAKPATFHAIAAQLGNKTANEVLERFQDLVKLFHKSSMLHPTSQSDPEIQSSTIEDEPD